MGKTYADAVVPVDYVVFAPLEGDVILVGCGNHFIQVVDDVVTFEFGHTNDLGDESRVEEQRLPACDGMDTNEWVLGCDWISANRTAFSDGVVGLHVGGVQCGQAFQILLIVGRQRIIGGILG